MNWTIEIAKLDKVTLEDVKFIFSQAEKKLDDTVKVCDSVTSRSYTILSILVGLLIALSGYQFNSILSFGINSKKSILSIIAIVYLLVCLFVLLRNIFPKPYSTLGSLPKDLFVNKFFEDKIEKEKQLLYLYMSEIENYQFRIDKNIVMNNKRLLILKKCLIAVYIFPIALFLGYFLVIS